MTWRLCAKRRCDDNDDDDEVVDDDDDDEGLPTRFHACACRDEMAEGDEEKNGTMSSTVVCCEKNGW